MGLFDGLHARGQVSARSLKQLERMVRQGRPALVSGAGVGTVSATTGAGGVDGGNELFLAEITAVSGSGTAAVYGWVEQTVVPNTGGTEDRTGGRRGSTTEDPARYAGSGTLAVNDLVLMRRNAAAPGEYEAVSAVGGVVLEDTFQFPLTYTGTIDPDTCEVTLTVATWQTVTVRAVGLEIEVS